MKIYLVDFENVKSKGLEGIDKLTETDSVIIFFSENSDTLSFEMHQKVLSSKADIEYFKVSVGGKNALDFQLSTLLGFMVAKETYSHIFVISNDKGFDFLHTFWSGNYIDTPSTIVLRTKTITAAIDYSNGSESSAEVVKVLKKELPAQIANDKAAANTQPEQVQPAEVKESAPKKRRSSGRKPQSFDEMFHSLLNGVITEKDYDKVRELFAQSQTKEEFHNALAKIYKQQGTDIYKAVKSRYSRLRDRFCEETTVQTKQEPVPEKQPDKLTEILADICTQSEIDRVRSCIDNTQSKKDFYLSMIKEFQKKKGCEFYKAVRSQYSELVKKAQES